MKTATERRQGGRQGRTGKGKAGRTERRGEQYSILQPRVFKQLGEDLFQVGEELRVPIANLASNVLDDAFSLAKSLTHQVGSLIEDAIDEADRTIERLAVRGKRRGNGTEDRTVQD